MKKLLSITLTLLMAAMITVCSVFPSFAATTASDARDSVVVVSTCFKFDNGLELSFSYGTGFFVGKDGESPQYLITNYHVIDTYDKLYGGKQVSFEEVLIKIALDARYDEEDTAELLAEFEEYLDLNGRALIMVNYDDKTSEEGYLVTADDIDYAVLRIAKPTTYRKPLTLAEPTDDMVGEEVMAIGYPGLNDADVLKPTTKWDVASANVSSGVFGRVYIESGVGRELIQNDCLINGGNSGGPLILKDSGAVIGLNTFTLYNDEASTSEVSVAVSMNNVIPALNQYNVPYTLSDGSTQAVADATSAAGATAVADATAAADATVAAGATAAPAQTDMPAQTEAAQAQENDDDSKGSDMTMIIVIIVVAVVIAMGVAAAVIIIMNKNKKTAQAAEEAKAAAEAAAAAAANQVKTAYLRSLAPQHGGARIKLSSGNAVMIGRSRDCKIVFKEGTPGVSSKHCTITFNQGKNDFILTDLKSSFGTYLVDGTKLNPNTPYRLRSGDRFYVGDKANTLCVELE